MRKVCRQGGRPPFKEIVFTVLLLAILPYGSRAFAQDEDSQDLDSMAYEVEPAADTQPTPDTLETNHYDQSSQPPAEMDSDNSSEASARDGRANAKISKLKGRLDKIRHNISISDARYTKAERQLQKTAKELDAVLEKLKAAKKHEKKSASRAKSMQTKLAAARAKLLKAKKELRLLEARASKDPGRSLASVHSQ